MVLALIATRSIESFLYGVPRTDPLTLFLTAVLLAGASVLAAAAPGRRAARLAPLEALRTE
jgi:ABC-type lipoprotein release transport system permease subunit